MLKLINGVQYTTPIDVADECKYVCVIPVPDKNDHSAGFVFGS